MAEVEIEFKTNLKDVISELEAKAARALEAIGLQGENHAKRLCPVDTGNLRNSITHTTDEDTAYIGTNVEYAPYVELGTSKTKAQPYLRPAVEDYADEYKEIVRKFLKSDN